MTPSSSKELPGNLLTSPIDECSALKTAAIYGANASGKSNLLTAMQILGSLIRNPMEDPSGEDSFLKNMVFALDPAMASEPTRFSIRFIKESNIYDYTIAIGGGEIIEERLVVHPEGGRGQEWFHRTGEGTSFNPTHLKGAKQKLQSLTSVRHSVLSVALAFSHQQLSIPAQWMSSNLVERYELGDPFQMFETRHRRPRSQSTTVRCNAEPAFRTWVERVLNFADLGIQGLQIQSRTEKAMRPVLTPQPDGSGSVRVMKEVVTERYDPVFLHSVKGSVPIPFERQYESQGTLRLFAMLSPLYDIFQRGELALVDEFGVNMHTALVRQLIAYFHDSKINTQGSQLIFSTHNTSLLSQSLFRRDQVWFTEKDDMGVTDLYSLVEFKGVREGASFEKGYLEGRYNAIPFFGSFDFPPISEEEDKKA